MPKPPPDAYRKALVESRRAVGAATKETGAAIRNLLAEWGRVLEDELSRLPANRKAAARAAKEIVGELSRDLNIQLEKAIADGRALAYEEITEAWDKAQRRIFAAADEIPGGTLGAIRVPAVNLYGAFDAIGAAANWRTLVSEATGHLAAEANGVLAEGLAMGVAPDEIARRMRGYVEGSQKFAEAFEFAETETDTIRKIDLRKIPKASRGGAFQMRYNAERIAYSEFANARKEAEVQSFLRDPAVRAVRWELSPDRGSQEEPDECDILAQEDLYGLGPGLYPLDKVPPSPHPFDRCELMPEYGEPGLEKAIGNSRSLPGTLSSISSLSPKAAARVERNLVRVLDEGETFADDLAAVLDDLPKVPPGTPPPPTPTPTAGRKFTVEDLPEGWTVRVYGGDGKPIQKRYISPTGKMYSSLKKVEEAILAGTEAGGGRGGAVFENASKPGRKTPVGGKTVTKEQASVAEAVGDARFVDPLGLGVEYETVGSASRAKPPPHKPVGKKALADLEPDSRAIDVRDTEFLAVENELAAEGWTIEQRWYKRVGRYGREEEISKATYDELLAGGAKRGRPRFADADDAIGVFESRGYKPPSTLPGAEKFKVRFGESEIYGQGLVPYTARIEVTRALQFHNSALAQWEARQGLPARLAAYEKIPDPPKFKSTAKVEAWLEERYPNLTVDFQKVDLKAAQAMAEEWVVLARDWPGVADEIKYIGTLRRKAKTAGVTRDTGIFRKKRFKNAYGLADPTDHYIGMNPTLYDKGNLRATVRSKIDGTLRNMGGTFQNPVYYDETGRSWNAARGVTEPIEKKLAALQKKRDDLYSEYITSYGKDPAVRADIERRHGIARDAVNALLDSVAGDYVKTTFRHEFGHHIEYVLKRRTPGDAPLLPFKGEYPLDLLASRKAWKDQFFAKHGYDAAGATPRAEWLSVYSTKNEAEFWAEMSNAFQYGEKALRADPRVAAWEKLTKLLTDPRNFAAPEAGIEWSGVEAASKAQVAKRLREIADDFAIGDRMDQGITLLEGA